MPDTNRDTSTTASPQRVPGTAKHDRAEDEVRAASTSFDQLHATLHEPPGAAKPHLLKNGAPAHVLTTEDRRKGAATTNAIKRARRAAYEDEKFERAIAEMVARDEARRARRRERYLRQKRERPSDPAPASHEPAALPSYEEHVANIAEAQRRARERGHAYGPD